MSRIIGIDLGTTNSCVSIVENGAPIIIPNAEGNRTTPSAVAFKDGEFVVGEAAKRQIIINPNSVLSFKSKMGTGFKYNISGKKYYAQELSTILLKSLKKQAEDYLGEPVTNAVITVPARFDQAAREATRSAAIEAGLSVERVIAEPTAAALAYHLDKLDEYQTILVYDLGGGTFDVTLLTIDNGVCEVSATAGNSQLGGDNFDEYLTKHLVKKIEREHGVKIKTDKMIMRRVREAAEKAKRELSSTLATDITLPFLTVKNNEPIHFNTTLTRDEFDEITKPLVLQTRDCLLQVFIETGLEFSDIDKVILVGGSTRIPAIQKMVKEITGLEPFKGINPDEAVAVGAAVQGAVLSGDLEGIVLVDVTSLTLGLAISGGLFSPLVPKNTPIPTSFSKTFTTAFDNQTTVTLDVYQGERKFASDNRLLGTLQLRDLPEQPAGHPKIEVTFNIDANGIVSVSAKDKATGRMRTAILQSELNLSKDEKEEMIHKAEAHAEEDAAKAKEVEDISYAESVIKLAYNTILSLNAEVKANELERVKALTKELESILHSENKAKLRESTEYLRNALGLLLANKAMYDLELREELV